ncbi:two-component system LytT family sensor kinase [Pedobacter sp. UYP24]
MKLKESAKIELIAFTACAVIAFFFNAGVAISEHGSIPNHVYYNNYWSHLLFSYIITCVCYFILFFFVDKELEQEEKQPSITVVLICLLINVCFIIRLVNEYFAILLAIKMLIIYLNSIKGSKKANMMQDAIMLFAFSIFMHASVVILNVDYKINIFFTSIAPLAILHYLYSLHVLVPMLINKRRSVLKFIGYTILITGISFLAMMVIHLACFGRADTNDFIYPFNLPFQLVLVPIMAWNIYKSRNRKDIEEIKSLKTELGKSDANLNFLKSQINPHFLFNALNTLYGTALQENAERTSEGIQRLGDMMRFMLEENVADKTFLSRDIDYLKNYIDLQKLRTATTANIHIDTQLEDPLAKYLIAPMVLIPFVENAFKHGISLNSPSHIKITLQTKGDKLFFDVNNSIHVKNENDPERLQSGIGLRNVKERLALLYPNKHELIIRENATEFFVHLTIELEEIK